VKNDPPSLRDVLFLIGVIALGVALAIGWVTLNYELAKRYGSGAEILPVWYGVRAFLVERVDPYGLAVAEQIQRAVYGRPARLGEFPFALDIPFPLLLLFFPLAPIPDPLWGRAAWMTLSQAGVVLLALLPFRILEWRPAPWLIALLIGFALFWSYSLEAFWSSSFSVVLTLLLLQAFLLMYEGNDELAGILLAVSAMKWEYTALLWALLLLVVWITKRWRVVVGLAMGWLVLGAASFLINPGWLWPYLRAVAVNWRADAWLNTHSFLAEWFPRSAEPLTWLITALLLLLLLLEWFAAVRHSEAPRLLWSLGLGVAITPLIGLPTGPAHVAPLIFSLSVAIPFAWLRWDRFANGLIAGMVLLFFVLPWLATWFFVGIYAQVVRLFLPSLLLLLLLYWVRWYVVRPPRTWLDHVRRTLRR